MTKQQIAQLEQLCLAMVDYFHTDNTTVEEMQEWMKTPANCVYLIHRIQDMKNILENKEI